MTIDSGAYSKLVYFPYGLSKKMGQREHEIQLNKLFKGKDIFLRISYRPKKSKKVST
jgi:hypothetical protein